MKPNKLIRQDLRSCPKSEGLNHSDARLFRKSTQDDRRKVFSKIFCRSQSVTIVSILWCTQTQYRFVPERITFSVVLCAQTSCSLVPKRVAKKVLVHKRFAADKTTQGSRTFDSRLPVRGAISGRPNDCIVFYRPTRLCRHVTYR